MFKFRSIAALGVRMAIYMVMFLCCFRKFRGINLICIRIYLRNNIAMAIETLRLPTGITRFTVDMFSLFLLVPGVALDIWRMTHL